MHRIPMPKASLLLVALGGALLFGHQVAVADDAATGSPTASAVVYTVPAANAHPFAADLSVDDASSATLR